VTATRIVKISTGGSSTAEPAANAAPATSHERTTGTPSDLFGRRLVYVVVWGLQVASASVISPVLAYLMGPAQFGLLATAIAVHQVLVVLALFGIDQAVILQRSRDESGRASRGLLTVGIAMAVAVTAVVGLTSPLWSRPFGFGGVTSLVVATVLWTAPGAAVQMMLALLSSEDRLKSFASVSVLSAVGGQVFGILLLLTNGRTAGVYAWGGVISQFGAFAIGVAVTRPAVRHALSRAVTYQAIAIGLPLTLRNLSAFVLNAGDRVVVQHDLGPAAVGRYQIAYTLGYVVVLLLSSITNSWSPRIAAIEDEAERRRMLARSRDAIFAVLMPVILGITLGAPLLLRVIAPSSFQPASLLIVVYLVVLSAVPYADGNSATLALLASRRGRPIAVAAGVAAVGNVALNIALVPVLGITGSALATLLAYGGQTVLMRHQLRHIGGLPPADRRSWLMLAVVAAVAGASVPLPQSTAWNVAKFALAIGCLPWFVERLRAARRSETAAA
jgi:O-antigen/teichoic acid export membrane protein